MFYIYIELPSIASSRAPSPGLSISPETEGASTLSVEPRSPSPKEEPWVMFTRHRTYSDAQYENTEVILTTSSFKKLNSSIQ
jgi:hypothetical protein